VIATGQRRHGTPFRSFQVTVRANITSRPADPERRCTIRRSAPVSSDGTLQGSDPDGDTPTEYGDRETQNLLGEADVRDHEDDGGSYRTYWGQRRSTLRGTRLLARYSNAVSNYAYDICRNGDISEFTPAPGYRQPDLTGVLVAALGTGGVPRPVADSGTPRTSPCGMDHGQRQPVVDRGELGYLGDVLSIATVNDGTEHRPRASRVTVG